MKKQEKEIERVSEMADKMLEYSKALEQVTGRSLVYMETKPSEDGGMKISTTICGEHETLVNALADLILSTDYMEDVLNDAIKVAAIKNHLRNEE